MADLRLPSLLPKVVDPIWFCVDKPVDDHEELCKLEEEHKTWVGVGFRNAYQNLPNLPRHAPYFLYNYGIIYVTYQQPTRSYRSQDYGCLTATPC